MLQVSSKSNDVELYSSFELLAFWSPLWVQSHKNAVRNIYLPLFTWESAQFAKKEREGWIMFRRIKNKILQPKILQEIFSCGLLKRTPVILELEENNKWSDLRNLEIKITNDFLLKPNLVFTTVPTRPVPVFWTSYIRSSYVLCPGCTLHFFLYNLPFTLLISTCFNEKLFCGVIHNTVILNPF